MQYTIALFWNLVLALVLALHYYCGDNVKYRLLQKTTIWRLKKSHSNDKPLEKITPSSYYMEQKTFIEASCIYNIHTAENCFLQLLVLKVCQSFRLGQIKKLEVYLGLYESFFTFIVKRRPNKYCLCEANSIRCL